MFLPAFFPPTDLSFAGLKAFLRPRRLKHWGYHHLSACSCGVVLELSTPRSTYAHRLHN